MGRNKALLELDGIPLWRRQWTLLSEAGAAPCFVSVRAGDDWLPTNVPRLVDDGEKGPFGGLLASLQEARGTHVITLAVDLPRLPVSWVERLQTSCAAGVGAVGHNPRIGAFEPLAAIYPVQLRTLATEAAASGAYCLQSLLTGAVTEGLLRVETIAPDEELWFTNWNKPNDVTDI